MADLSHRLRTPLTALRIDAESVRDSAEMERLLGDVSSVERTVSEIIREARRPGAGTSPLCDAAQVIAERAAFWRPLAEDQDRRMTVEVAPDPVHVLVSSDDGPGFGGPGFGGAGFGGAGFGGAGFGGADPTRRGQSSGGSVTLGLGSPAGPPEEGRRHRRSRFRLRTETAGPP